MPISTKQSLFRSAFVLFFVVLTTSAFAQNTNNWTTYSFSACNVALGGAMGAVPDAFDAVDINPAGIGLLGGSDFTFSQGILSSTLLTEHFVYSQRLENGDGFALGGDYFYYTTSFPGYTPLAVNAYLGYGLHLTDSLRAGVTGHFLTDNFQVVTTGVSGSADVGLYFRRPKSPLSISLSATDLGANLDNNTLPMQMHAAWAYQVNLTGEPYSPASMKDSRLTLMGQGNWSLIDRTFNSFDIGAEGWIRGVFALRAGYQFANFANSSAPLGISAGAGARFDDVQVDYAFTTMGDFTTSHQVSLSLMLGGKEQTPTPQPTPMETATPVVTETPVATAAAQETEAPTAVATEETPVVTEVPADNNVPEAARPMWHEFRKGMNAYQSHDYSTAAKGLKEAINTPGSTNWRYAESYAMLGVIAEYYDHSKGHLAQAKAYYQKALKLDPKNATARKHIKRWQ